MCAGSIPISQRFAFWKLPQDDYSVQLRMTKRCRDREKPMCGLLTEPGLNVAPVHTGGALLLGPHGPNVECRYLQWSDGPTMTTDVRHRRDQWPGRQTKLLCLLVSFNPAVSAERTSINSEQRVGAQRVGGWRQSGGGWQRRGADPHGDGPGRVERPRQRKRSLA